MTPTKGKIAFVAEAPGEEEVIRGRPLVGPSGRVFDAALRTAGIDRAQCFVGNVFSQKAPDNDETIFTSNKALCQREFARLSEELTCYQPDVIVPLGETALWAFTGHRRIDSFRGAVQSAATILPRAKLLPTYHPARVIRQWKLFAVMNGDFVKASEEAAKGPKIIYPKATILLEPGIEDVEEFLGLNCATSPLTSVDIETGWGQITCVGFAPSESLAMCIPFVDMRRPTRSYWADPQHEVRAILAIKQFMENPACAKLGQNFGYDAMWLWKVWHIASFGYREDTRLQHHALYPELEKSLAFMAGSYTGVGAFKHWGGSYSEEKRDD